jgi:hypothetical protein
VSWDTEYARGSLTPGAPWTPFVPQEPFEYGPEFMPGRLNVRVPVGGSRHFAPDPSTQGGAYGEVPSRPPRIQVATTLAPYEYQSEMRFVYGDPGNVDLVPGVWLTPGYMEPWSDRTNIDVPPHVAYGSLFTQNHETYGYG